MTNLKKKGCSKRLMFIENLFPTIHDPASNATFRQTRIRPSYFPPSPPGRQM